MTVANAFAQSPERDSQARVWWTVLSALRRSRSAQFGVLTVGLVSLAAIVGPFFVSDPLAQDLRARLLPPAWVAGGDPAYLLGTDQLGRDLLARTIYGARISLLIALISVAIGGSLGVLLGLLSGYFGGRLDTIIMRLADIQLAFPFILLVILVVAVVGASVANLIIVLGVTSWVLYARVVRSQVLSLREKEFVEAARNIGATHGRVLRVHILPNAFSSVIVIASFAAAQVIIAEAALSFLGLGVQPPDASWGRMLADSRNYLTTHPWLAIIPGMAIVVAVLGVNLLGDWLRDELDPRLKI